MVPEATYRQVEADFAVPEGNKWEKARGKEERRGYETWVALSNQVWMSTSVPADRVQFLSVYFQTMLKL